MPTTKTVKPSIKNATRRPGDDCIKVVHHGTQYHVQQRANRLVIKTGGDHIDVTTEAMKDEKFMAKVMRAVGGK